MKLLKTIIAATLAAACVLPAQAADKTMSTDIVVLGAGCGGTSASVAAQELGAKVILLEKQGITGGTCKFSEGIMAVESKMQRDWNYGLTKDDAFQRIMRYGHWRGNGRVVRAFVEKTASTIDWMQGNGVKFEKLFSNYPDGLYTWHIYEGRGAGWLAKYQDKFVKNGGTLLLNTPATDLIQGSDGVVRGVIAKNKDGDKITINAKAVIIATGGFGANEAMKKKYLRFPGVPAILISVEDKDQARAQRLQQELTNVAGGALGNSQAAVLSQTVQQDKELEKQAKANNISTGKAALIRQAMALNDSLTFEGLAQLSVEELRDLIEAGAPGMPIGMQAALEAAAQYAGLTTADITDADVDPELDETPAHYEVEFQVPGKGELEYKVEAYTGQVLSGPANVQPSTPVNPSGDIGMEAAKSAALKHAGLSTAVFTKAERDYDDGRLEYELEFHTDSAAYEVTVDAATGRVLDYEKENLRGGTGSTDIGAQAAKSAALRHAGLSEGQVQQLQVEWDSEHGRAVYEVEFKSGGMEYDYVIDAATGAVLEHQAERHD